MQDQSRTNQELLYEISALKQKIKKLERSESARKQAEDALRLSESKLQATLYATLFPIAIVDLQDDNFIFWSHSAFTLFGHTASTASEWYQYQIAYPDPDYRSEVIERWKSSLEIARESNQSANTGEIQVNTGLHAKMVLYAFANSTPHSSMTILSLHLTTSLYNNRLR